MDVDINTLSAGYAVGWMTAGEWLQYYAVVDALMGRSRRYNWLACGWWQIGWLPPGSVVVPLVSFELVERAKVIGEGVRHPRQAALAQ